MDTENLNRLKQVMRQFVDAGEKFSEVFHFTEEFEGFINENFDTLKADPEINTLLERMEKISQIIRE